MPSTILAVARPGAVVHRAARLLVYGVPAALAGVLCWTTKMLRI